VAAIGFFNIWNFLCYYVSAANQPRVANKKSGKSNRIISAVATSFRLITNWLAIIRA
jgi:hypothetical protein